MGTGSACTGEFLVGCKQKEKIFLTLEEESRAFISLIEDRKETFTVKKNTWGFLEVDVRAEGDFLSVEHTHLTTEEFIGNSYRLEYFITMDKLHKGSNFGQIILETPYETLNYEVVVEKDISRDEEYRENDREFAGILKSFLQYEGGRVDLDTWTEDALRRISRLRERMAIMSSICLLMHISVCWDSGWKKQNGCWSRTIITVLRSAKMWS